MKQRRQAPFRSAIERLARVRIIDLDLLPRGLDPFFDLRSELAEFSPRVVFDVGANRGESAATYLTEFPLATIFSFEPVPSTFAALAERFSGDARVECLALALGSCPGRREMAVPGEDTTLASLSPSPFVRELSSTRMELIEMQTLDRFVEDRGIDRIDYLKLDTEGHDLRVLEGSERSLRSGSVKVVEVESGFSPENRTHVPFETLRNYLQARDFRLFGIYEQMREWTIGAPHLRRVNAVFIAADLAARPR